MPAGWCEDTDPEALEVFLDLHRRMTPGRRVARVFELGISGKPAAGIGAVHVSAGQRTGGFPARGRPPAGPRDHAAGVRLGSGTAAVIALAQAFQELLAALDRTETPFFVGGSVASSSHGLARQTNDIDIVADLTPDRVPALCEALGPGFYADADMVSPPLLDRMIRGMDGNL